MNKQDFARAIADLLGVRPQPNWFSVGSKVTYFFQKDIADQLGVPYYGLNKVPHMRAILQSVAVPWDEVRHSSEDTDHPGGNVTKEAYEDLLVALETLLDEDRPLREPGLADEYVQRSIRRRRGQASFRAGLLVAYEGRCAVTGSEATAVLEAAHIVPFSDHGVAEVGNGLLLRSDIHTLFDLRLISINPRTWSLVVDPSLDGTEYGELRDVIVARPSRVADRPRRSAVQEHFERSGILD